MTPSITTSPSRRRGRHTVGPLARAVTTAAASAGVVAAVAVGPTLLPAAGTLPHLSATPTASTALLSSGPTGLPGNGRSALVDARPGTAAFDSVATDLVAGATTGVPQSYLKLFTGRLTLASTSPSTGPARRGSTGVGFAPDGATFLFVARGGLDGAATGPQAYVRDVASGDVTLVSGTGATPLANHGLSVLRSSYSASGTRIVFAARDTTFGAGWQVVVKDLVTGSLSLASLTTRGAAMSSTQESPPVVAFSPDASAVYFDSEADKVVPGAPPGQVYRHELASGVTGAVSLDPGGVPCRGHLAAVLSTGRVVFDSPGLCAAGVPRAKGNVFVTGPGGVGTALVSSTAAGTAAGDLSTFGAATPDGRAVAFTSGATNLGVPNAAPQIPQIYLKDLTTGALTLLTDPPGRVVAKKVGYTHDMQFDPAGRQLLFPSAASNLLTTTPTQPQEVYATDLATGVTTGLSVDASGAELRSPFARWADSTHAVLTDDRAGQVYLRTLP